MSPPPLLGRYRLLAVDVAVHVEDPEVADLLSVVLRPFLVEEPGGRCLAVEGAGEGFLVTLDGAHLFRADDRRDCVTWTIWRLNELVAETPCDRLLVHASVAHWDGGAVLFPGQSGAGKSTLVAGLVRAGLGYLSDELAPIRLGTSFVEPYPRAITLEQGSWPWFAELESGGRRVRATDQWFVPADLLRPGCIVRTAQPITAVIFPRTEPGGSTEVLDLPRPQALMRIARQAVNLTEHGAGGFRTLANLIRDARVCVELVSASLDGAVEAVLATLSTARDHRGP